MDFQYNAEPVNNFGQPTAAQAAVVKRTLAHMSSASNKFSQDARTNPYHYWGISPPNADPNARPRPTLVVNNQPSMTGRTPTASQPAAASSDIFSPIAAVTSGIGALAEGRSPKPSAHGNALEPAPGEEGPPSGHILRGVDMRQDHAKLVAMRNGLEKFAKENPLAIGPGNAEDYWSQFVQNTYHVSPQIAHSLVADYKATHKKGIDLNYTSPEDQPLHHHHHHHKHAAATGQTAKPLKDAGQHGGGQHFAPNVGPKPHGMMH